MLIITAVAAVSCFKPKAHKFSYPLPETKEDCMALFEDILATQAKREAGFMKIEKDLGRLQAGDMSVRKFRKKRVEWIDYEKNLQTKVAHMYDIGYTYGCFAVNG